MSGSRGRELPCGWRKTSLLRPAVHRQALDQGALEGDDDLRRRHRPGRGAGEEDVSQPPVFIRGEARLPSMRSTGPA